jgi:hypothetical protein
VPFASCFVALSVGFRSMTAGDEDPIDAGAVPADEPEVALASVRAPTYRDLSVEAWAPLAPLVLDLGAETSVRLVAGSAGNCGCGCGCGARLGGEAGSSVLVGCGSGGVEETRGNAEPCRQFESCVFFL